MSNSTKKRATPRVTKIRPVASRTAKKYSAADLQEASERVDAKLVDERPGFRMRAPAVPQIPPRIDPLEQRNLLGRFLSAATGDSISVVQALHILVQDAHVLHAAVRLTELEESPLSADYLSHAIYRFADRLEVVAELVGDEIRAARAEGASR